MQLIIAEKPSVAQSIAAVLGATKRNPGYLEGADVLISWCVGHLVELAPADRYDARYIKWRWEDLPILPGTWEYTISKPTKTQYETLKNLLHDRRVDTVICATDAGREGELIFRLVYEKCVCTKPVKRLWISSLEDSAIRAGLENMEDSTAYDSLYQAALCRAKADWLVGINATRFFSLLYGQTLNVGRVMTPTLALIVSREAQIAAFQSEPFFTVQISCGFIAQTQRLASSEDAERIRNACHLQTATVKDVQIKARSEQPPKLYDLTTLQRDANRLYGFTAQQTLDYAQSLYEKKLITYPRTDSQYLTHDMVETLPTLVTTVSGCLPFAAGLDLPVHCEKVINDDKVTDHHAILPTHTLGDTALNMLPTGEQDVFRLVAVRLLCAVGDAHLYDETAVTLECEGQTFNAKGKTIAQMGWRIPGCAFRGSLGTRYAMEMEKENALPELKKGKQLSPVVATVKEGKTSPPKHYTEDTLLAAMETAGAEDLPEDAERKGLGTPATRAGILEKLVKTGFVQRKGDTRAKHLLPTTKGTALITVVPELIQSPTMTADWEHRLKEIEHSHANATDFMSDVQAMLTELVATYKVIDGAEVLFPNTKEIVGRCPRCGANVMETSHGFFCQTESCKFALWKNSRFFTSIKKPLTKAMVVALLTDGRVPLKGCVSEKTGKTYDTMLLLMDDGQRVNFRMEFDQR